MRVGVILFRAQPFHNGHLEMVKKAYEENDKVYIFVGSADKSGTKRNPLPIDFRVELIRHSLQECGCGYQGLNCNAIHIVPLNDLTDESDNSHE